MNDAHYENIAATLAAEQAEAEEASTEQRTAAERCADAVDDAENAPSGDYQTFLLDEHYRIRDEARDLAAEASEVEAERARYLTGLWY